MTSPEPPPPAHRVPTLTEVIDVPEAAPTTDVHAPSTLPSEAELVRRVMLELQRQIDVLLEYRVREVLGPVLARAADSVVREARTELASTLRDVVARAVESEVARARSR